MSSENKQSGSIVRRNAGGTVRIQRVRHNGSFIITDNDLLFVIKEQRKSDVLIMIVVGNEIGTVDEAWLTHVTELIQGPEQ